MDITGVFIVFYVTSISGVLGLYRHTYSACYGITTDNFIKASCPGDDEKIVMDSVYAYAKPLSTNCPEVMTSAATTPESCCQYASDDCGSEYEGFNKNTYFENCHGRTTCSWTPVTWTNAPCNSSIYSMRTSYMVVYFYCISENDVKDVSEDGSVNTTTALLLNPGYESGNGTGTLPPNSSYRCSISASCATSLKIRALNLNFTEEGGICGQSLTLTDETNTRVLRCDSNTDYLPYDLEIGNNTHYLEIQVDNTLNTDSGYFILQIGSNHDDDVVTLACGTSVGEGKVAEEDLPECSDATAENKTETTTTSMDNETDKTTVSPGNTTVLVQATTPLPIEDEGMQNDVKDVSEDGSVNTTTALLLNPGYESGNDTGTLPANSSYKCSISASCATSLKIRALNLNFTEEGGICGQSLTITDETNTRVLRCDSNTDYLPYDLEIGNNTHYLEIQVNNTLDTDSGYFLLQIGSDHGDDVVTLACGTSVGEGKVAEEDLPECSNTTAENNTDTTTASMDNITDITTPYMGNDTDITTPYMDNDTDITTPYMDNGTDITTPYMDNDTDITTPYMDNDTDITTPFMINNTNTTTPSMDNDTDKTTVSPDNTTALVQGATPVPIEDEGIPSWVYALVVLVVLLLVFAALFLFRNKIKTFYIEKCNSGIHPETEKVDPELDDNPLFASFTEPIMSPVAPVAVSMGTYPLSKKLPPLTPTSMLEGKGNTDNSETEKRKHKKKKRKHKRKKNVSPEKTPIDDLHL